MIRWINVLGALVLALGVGLMLGLGASAQAASDDTVLLTVQIEGDDASTTTFTRDQLMALGQTSFETETIWTSGRL